MSKRLFPLLVLSLFLPAFSFAAEGGSSNWNDFFLKAANLILLLTLLHVVASKPVKSMLRGMVGKRAARFEESSNELERSKREHEALKKKIEGLKAEFATMQAVSLKATEQRKDKMIEDARDFSEKLLKQTDEKIKQKFIQAEQQIKTRLIDQSIALAAGKLAASSANRNLLTEEAVERLLNRES